MIGGILIAYMSHLHIRGRVISLASLGLPIFIAFFSLVTFIPTALGLMIATGLCFILVLNNSNALMQTSMPDAMRGRGMSIFTMVFFGSVPIGALIAGQMAEIIGEPTTVLILAFCLAVSALAIWFRFPGLRVEK